MEPLLPSEVARLVYGYLKKEQNEETAVCFLKSSPHLNECYQMYKANRNFNIKFNGFNLHDIFDIFGTMCSMINNRISEECESKTMIERLQYLLDLIHVPIKEDKCVATEFNMIDKCVGDAINTQNKSTHTLINIGENESTSEVLEIPSFTEIVSNDVSKTNKIETVNETNITVEKNSSKLSSPCILSTTQLINTMISTSSISKNEDKESPNFQINKQICSTPAKNNVEPTLHFSPKNIHNQLTLDELECQKIPEATSLESMPGLSKEDEPKDSSVVVDTGELVDTFLNDQSLLEKLADTINKSIEAQKETDDLQEGKILDPPTLEKALDSTQSDPQIKNILDEFLVFNVDNSDDSKKMCFEDQKSSIKSRLRSAKNKDIVSNKLKKPSSNVLKHIACNEETKKIDNNIVLYIQSGNTETVIDNYDLLSNQVLLQSNISNVTNNLSTTATEQDIIASKFVKIAPKLTSTSTTPLAHEKSIFPKRRKRILESVGIKSNFRKNNITSISTPSLAQAISQSIIIEVPNQNAFETHGKNNVDNNITQLSKISSKAKNTHDTPDDNLKPPKNKSMSTPRRRSTHIRCLDFSTPQPKNNRDQARSKLFSDTPKREEKILEEPAFSPLPKLQADWGSVNGFESIVNKEATRHWDTGIREMVGAGTLTSDADGRKTRKKKTPRKKIKPIIDKKNSKLVIEEEDNLNNSMQTNESQSNAEINKSNTTNDLCDLNEQNYNKPLLEDKKSLDKQNKFPISPEISSKVLELCSKQLLDKNSNDQELLEKQNELITLETPNKNTELCNKPPIESYSVKDVTDKEHSKFPMSLETPNKITELYIKQPIEFYSLKDVNDKKQNEFPVSLEILDKIPESCNKQATIETNLNISSHTLNNLELSKTNINEQENNLNQLNTLTTVSLTHTSTTSSNSKAISEIKENKEKDSNFLETFNNHNYLNPLLIKQPENNLNKSTENVNQPILSDQIKTDHSNKSNSPVQSINKIQSIKHLVETPFKCDDTAVDVPETPISKLIREYDPSKLITPLPCTPEHCEDSLSETPLTKVFRETSYLNRPPISPFPPTPGNSRSVDTLLVQSDQECSKMSNNICNKINGIKESLTQPISNDNKFAIQRKKIKSTPLKTKSKPLIKSKIKNDLKGKSVEAKKKQVYEFVKAELFGSEISSSSSADELEKTNQQPKPIIVINKKQEDKKSGFKPIPKMKSIQSTSILVNGVENNPLNEFNTKISKSLSIQPTIVPCKDGSLETKNLSNIKQSKKSNKSMVHFEDPVQKIFNIATNPTLNKSKKVNINKIQNKTVTNENPEQLVGLSRYLNKSNDYNYTNKKRSKTIELEVTTSKLNNSDDINNLNCSKEDKCNEKISEIMPSSSKNKPKTYDISNEQNRSSQSSLIDENKNSNRKEKNTVLKKSAEPLNFVKSTKTSDQNPISLKSTCNTNLDRTNQSDSTTSNNNSLNNTSCVTVGYNEESNFQLRKFDVPLNNMEFLKRPKVYEVISEDGNHEMVHLHLSEVFTFLDIPSKLNNIQQSTSNVSPLITNSKALDVTPEIVVNELVNDDNILMHATSTPKDIIEKQVNDRQNRERRSPSFWDDSIHNYPINKYRDDRHRESNRWKNKSYRDNRHDKKYWSKSRHDDERSQLDRWNHSQWSHYVNIKRDFRDDSVRDKERSKYKEDKRRNYRDYNNYDERKGRDLEESKRFLNQQRMSQNDITKKATKRPADRTDHNKTPAKVSKVEHQRLLKNVNVDDFLSVVHGQK